MPNYALQQTIPTADNLNANYATNIWHCQATDLVAAEDFAEAIQAFYVNWSPNLSSLVRQTGWTQKVYDLADPQPRYPVLERSFDLSSAPSGGPLPPEVALVMSFQAERQSGVPQARKRNRVYLPFLDASVNGTDGRPNSSVIAAVQDSGADLLLASNAAADWTWMVYSKVLADVDIVDNGWIDNEWDTQRRRGRVATTRTVF